MGTRSELNCLEAAQRPAAMPSETYSAWLASGIAVDLGAPASLDAAADLTAQRAGAKGAFFILRTTREGRRYLHSYTVKRSTKRGGYRAAYDNTHAKVFEGNLEAVPAGMIQVYGFTPVEPWQWTAADPIGLQHGICPDLRAPRVIEGSAS